MKKAGLLGCGKIGGAILQDIAEHNYAEITFIQDPAYRGEEKGITILDAANETLLQKTDIVIETATASVLKQNIEPILRNCDLMVFSVTAFAEKSFAEKAYALASRYGRQIYLPHGAILGVDGISDGASVITSVTVKTVKNPKSLGREDAVRTIVYDGSTRGACEAYPRNVNIHATVALAGIGFERTRSIIISDPGVHTNSHMIQAEGEGIQFRIDVSSYADGGVTGSYTPVSAIGSVRKVLDASKGYRFI